MPRLLLRLQAGARLSWRELQRIVLLSPVLIAAALAVKLQDGGPVLYRRRCGWDLTGDFDAFKLRSMQVDADAYLDQRPELKAA